MLLEIATVLASVIVGGILWREITLSRRWDPRFFRRGVLLYRRQRAADHGLVGRAFPANGIYFRYSELGPEEFAFVAPVSTFPLMRGLVELNVDCSLVVVSGRLNFGAPAFLALLVLLFKGAPIALGIAATALVADVIGERIRFNTLLQRLTTGSGNASPKGAQSY